MYNLCDVSTSEGGQFGNFYRKKQIDVSFSRVCPVIDNKFRHNIVKVQADPLHYRLKALTML